MLLALALVSLALRPTRPPTAPNALESSDRPPAGRSCQALTVRLDVLTDDALPTQASTSGLTVVLAQETPTASRPPLMPRALAVAFGTAWAVTVTGPWPIP